MIYVISHVFVCVYCTVKDLGPGNAADKSCVCVCNCRVKELGPGNAADKSCVCVYCRVKELGPGNAADSKASDVAPGGAALSPQRSDLALVRNANVSVF